jgi:hypothetical protein
VLYDVPERRYAIHNPGLGTKNFFIFFLFLECSEKHFFKYAIQYLDKRDSLDRIDFLNKLLKRRFIEDKNCRVSIFLGGFVFYILYIIIYIL